MRLTLKKRNGGYRYQAAKCLEASDGSGYIKSVEEFTKGYKTIREKYFNSSLYEKKLKKKTQEMLKMYGKQLNWKEIYIRNDKGKLKKIKK